MLSLHLSSFSVFLSKDDKRCATFFLLNHLSSLFIIQNALHLAHIECKSVHFDDEKLDAECLKKRTLSDVAIVAAFDSSLKLHG